jgi:hypothetical protein
VCLLFPWLARRWLNAQLFVTDFRPVPLQSFLKQVGHRHAQAGIGICTCIHKCCIQEPVKMVLPSPPPAAHAGSLHCLSIAAACCASICLKHFPLLYNL